MTDSVFSETPPTEPGWYWVQRTGKRWGDPLCLLREKVTGGTYDGQTGWWTNDTDEFLDDAMMVHRGYEFGPKVPPPEQLAILFSELKIDAPWYPEMVEWLRTHCDF